jgi:ATP-dependent Lon protease
MPENNNRKNNRNKGKPEIFAAPPAVEETPALPEVLPVMPVRGMVLFPDMILPLLVTETRDTSLVNQVLLGDRFLALAPFFGENENEVKSEELYEFGCAGVILKMLKIPDGSVRLLVQGIRRLKLEKYLQQKPFFIAQTRQFDDVLEDGMKLDALHRSVRDQFTRLIELLPQAPEEVRVAAVNITHPGRFADLVAANINLSLQERCMILGEPNVRARLEKVSALIGRELQIVELGSKIQEDVKEKIGKGQREYFLREQLKTIRRELGEDDDAALEVEELKEALAKARLPEEAKKEADRELKRLERMQPGSAEYTVVRTYLDWMATLPWSKKTDDRLDIPGARKILDEDHYDLTKVKDRIVEYLAVRKVHPKGRSPILCFSGPPGVGKTSLGRSIARAMGREFVRISLGGVRDEAEIRGHRRTYIGALPGRILQGLRKAGTNNPVFMLDEIDKLTSDLRGDPSAALLEVLDPEQNNSFSDHYLDVAFDLSQVIFITTANQLDTIPPPLRDRMEILQIPGYSEEEKMQIARRHLLPRVLSEHGVDRNRIRIDASAVRKIIGEYTREAGLRNLERSLATVVRKLVVKIASGKRGVFKVGAPDVKKYLGAKTYFDQNVSRAEMPGVAVGLAWTATGGDVLFIESAKMAGKKHLELTGHLGDVIKESAQAALSWTRSHAAELGVQDNFFEDADIHIHFPEGAMPKDGPSAGITLVASLVSLLTKKSIAPRLAMTGEITLRGKVLPVGGIKEKMLAARRAGIRKVIIPAANIHDLDELPPEVKRDLEFHPIHEISEMLPVAFPEKKPHRKKAIRRI